MKASAVVKTVRDVGSITHQPTGLDIFARAITGRQPVARRQCSKLDVPAVEECVAGDEEGVGTVTQERVEGRVDLAAGTGVENLSLQSDSACSIRHIS